MKNKKHNKKVGKLQQKLISKILSKKYGWAFESVDFHDNGSMTIHWNWI